MYYNHNLRTDLQEWKNRLVRADYNQFGNQFKFFIDFIEGNKITSGILQEITSLYSHSLKFLQSFGCLYFALKFLIKKLCKIAKNCKFRV